MKYLILLLALALTACAMSPEEIALENQKLAIMKAVVEKPTLKCDAGCEYTDPKRNLAALFPKETNGWDFANKVLDVTTSVAPWVAVTKLGIEGIKSAGNNTTNNDSGNVTSGDVRGDEITSGDVRGDEIVSGDVRGDETIAGDTISSGDVVTETAGNDLIKAGNDVAQSPVTTTETPTTTTTTTTTTTVPEVVPEP